MQISSLILQLSFSSRCLYIIWHTIVFLNLCSGTFHELFCHNWRIVEFLCRQLQYNYVLFLQLQVFKAFKMEAWICAIENDFTHNFHKFASDLCWVGFCRNCKKKDFGFAPVNSRVRTYFSAAGVLRLFQKIAGIAEKFCQWDCIMKGNKKIMHRILFPSLSNIFCYVLDK